MARRVQLTEDQWQAAIAAEVRAQMAARRITDRQLAARLGIETHVLSKRKLGRVPFRLGEFLKICDIMGADVTEVLMSAKARASHHSHQLAS